MPYKRERKRERERESIERETEHTGQIGLNRHMKVLLTREREKILALALSVHHFNSQ